jgi:hypothetical protein
MKVPFSLHLTEKHFSSAVMALPVWGVMIFSKLFMRMENGVPRSLVLP